MRFLFLILLAGILRAEEVPLDLAKEYADTAHNGHRYEVFKDKKFHEVFQDNREKHCCPTLGDQLVTDTKEEDLCFKIWKWSTSILGPKSHIISMLIWKDDSVISFSIEFHGYSEKVPVTASDGLGRECCLRGHMLSSGELVNDDDFHDIRSELMGLSRTVKVKSTKWRLKDMAYPYDYDGFLNSVKAISSFVGKDQSELHYLASEMEDKDQYEDYLSYFDEAKVLRVWSDAGAKVFKAYASKHQLCSDEIDSMQLYKNWLVIHTDCDSVESPGPTPDYFLKRINHEWVLVWDDTAKRDPRYKIWIPKKPDEKEPGIHEENIPKPLRGYHE